MAAIFIGLSGISCFADPVTFFVGATPTTGGNEGYGALFVGDGHDWTVTIKGGPSSPDKGPVNFIDFLIYSTPLGGGDTLLTLTPGSPVTGHNTSDGGLYTDTGEWERQPSATDFWHTEWSSTSPGKYISPFGDNEFVGTFQTNEDASLAFRAQVYLESGNAIAEWYGDSSIVDEPSTLALFSVSFLSVLMLCRRQYRRLTNPFIE